MASQQEEMFDAMIKIAGHSVMLEEVKALPAEEEIDVSFSPDFEKKMNRLIKAQQKIRIMPAKRALRIAAACVAVLAILFLSAFTFIPPFREMVVDTLIEWTGRSADFRFSGGADNEEDIAFRPSYIPEGFYEIDLWEDGESIDITYANDAGDELYCSKRTLEGLLLSIDSEHSEYSTGTMHGLELHIFASVVPGYPSNLVFNDEIYVYSVI